MRYQFEQRPSGRGAVVRISDTGKRKTIATYKNQDSAWHVTDALNQAKDQEVSR